MALPTPEVLEQFDGHGGSLAEDGTRTATRVFLVTYPDLTGEDEADIEAIIADVEVNLPVTFLDPHPAYPTAIARTVDVRNAGADPRRWLASVGYSSKPLGERQSVEFDDDEDEPNVTPTSPSSPQTNSVQADQRPATLKVTNWTEPKALDLDAMTGDPVVNAAGDAFDPPDEFERTHYSFNFTFFRSPANLNWPDREILMDQVNDRIWNILGRAYGVGKLKVSKVEPSMVWDKGPGGALTLFWQLDVELKYKRGGWQSHLLNQGRREKVIGATLPDGTHPVTVMQILDQAGQPIADPVPLDEDGKRLAPGDPLVYLDFKRYPEADIRAVLR